MSRKKRGKKRSEMTPEELEQVRKLDREKKQRRRKNMEKEEKDRIRAIDKERRAEARGKMCKKKRDKIKIANLIRMRKNRLMETVEKVQIARNKAKMGMRVLRKEGPMRKYIERNKQHVWAVKWRKFLSQNPKYQKLEEKKKI